MARHMKLKKFRKGFTLRSVFERSNIENVSAKRANTYRFLYLVCSISFVFRYVKLLIGSQKNYF